MANVYHRPTLGHCCTRYLQYSKSLYDNDDDKLWPQRKIQYMLHVPQIPNLRCQTQSDTWSDLIMKLWKGNRRRQGSSDRAVTTHQRAKCKPDRGRWQWRRETDVQVTQKGWVTDRKHDMSCGIVTQCQSRESALSDGHATAFFNSRRWIIEVVSAQRRCHWSLGREVWYCLDQDTFLFSWVDTLPGTAAHGDTKRARCH